MPASIPLLSATSTTSPRRLQQIGAGHPAARRYSLARRNLLPRAERVVAVQGRWAHEQVVEAGAAVEVLLWCPDDPDADPDDVVRRLSAQAERSYRISSRSLARLHPGLGPPATLSLARVPRWTTASVLGPEAKLVLVADGIEYAGNLGALVRSVDASGAAGLMITSVVARITHHKVFTASRATVLTTPVVELSAVDARRVLAAAGFSVLVADPAALPTYLDDHDPAERLAVVVGSESEGVSSEWRREGLSRVAIPMRGRADSLNVAVSASILLFDAQRRLTSSR